MAELKTQRTGKSVTAFLGTIPDEQRREECFEIMKLMKQASKSEPKMWGPSIVGFGDYHYKSESGREGDWFIVGFSPRKQNLTLYIMGGLSHHGALLKKLGKHKTGGSCLYIKRLSDIDTAVLKSLVKDGVTTFNRSLKSRGLPK